MLFVCFKRPINTTLFSVYILCKLVMFVSCNWWIIFTLFVHGVWEFSSASVCSVLFFWAIYLQKRWNMLIPFWPAFSSDSKVNVDSALCDLVSNAILFRSDLRNKKYRPSINPYTINCFRKLNDLILYW